MKILLKIAFKGTNYNGYQVQGDTPTIQKALNDAADDLFGFPCDITGCSRTDSGVHAKCFCVTISAKKQDSIECSIPIQKIPRALNIRLPDDISVLCAAFVSDEFHPRYSVCEKTYSYVIDNSPERDPFSVGLALHFPKPITDDGIERMNAAAMLLCGTHDFTSFMAAGSKIVDATRTIRSCAVEKDVNKITIKVTADGFLYNMVRIICGTLLDVALGKTAPDAITDIINGKNRRLAGATLPADGLYLTEVKYPIDYFS